MPEQAWIGVIRKRVGKQRNARVAPQLLRLPEGNGLHATSSTQFAANYRDV